MIENSKDEVIRQQILPIQINWNQGNEKAIVVNVPTESSDSSFGRIIINAFITGGEKDKKKDQKKQQPLRQDLQSLKMEIQAQKKKEKVFNINMPYNRPVKKSNDSKLHFLLQLTDKNAALLTVVDDYCQTRLSIKGKAVVPTEVALQNQKKRLDQRRKNSQGEIDVDLGGAHNDPDFQDDEDDE